MSEVLERIATRRDVPRWVVVLALVGLCLTTVAGHQWGRDARDREVDALRTERDQLAVELVEEPTDYEGAPYEAGEHQEESGHQAARFPADRITWWVDPAGVERVRPAVTHAQVREAMRAAWAMWSERLAIEPVEVMDEGSALVRHRFGFIDGSSRTLAWSTLTDGSGRPQEQRYDTGETWSLGGPAPGQVSLPVVAAHEIGHAMGLGHDAGGSGTLMQPTYSSAITRPTDRDIGRMVQLGYARRVVPPTVPPMDGTLSVPATLRAADVVAELRRQGYTVTGPGGQ